MQAGSYHQRIVLQPPHCRDRRLHWLCSATFARLLTQCSGRGLRDLELRVLRTPSAPSNTLQDDPLRALRAVRFEAQLGTALALTLALTLLAHISVQ